MTPGNEEQNQAIKADLSIDVMFDIMSLLEPWPPISSEYKTSGNLPKMYKSQKEHMILWHLNQLCSTDEPKAFSYMRKTPNASTRVTYERFLNQYGLLWLAEALGEKEDVLREAIQASNEAEKVNYRLRCKAFRKVIPFDRIVELINSPSGWRYDPEMVEYLYFDDKTGQPYVKDECYDQFMETLIKEHCFRQDLYDVFFDYLDSLDNSEEGSVSDG